MTRLLAVPVLAFTFLAVAASARVGETEKELTARYGTITNRQPARKLARGQMHIYGERLGFKFEFWTVSAVIIGGKCEEIGYTFDGKWTEPHFQRLLDLNGGRQQWLEFKTRNPDNRRDWVRLDKATAEWGLMGFIVRTPVAERVLAALEKP